MVKRKVLTKDKQKKTSKTKRSKPIKNGKTAIINAKNASTLGIEEKAKRTTPCYTLDFSEEMYDSSELEEEEFCVAAAAAPNPDDYENEEDVDIDSIIKNFESLMESEDSGEIVKENVKDDE